jgi:hypothetical protein
MSHSTALLDADLDPYCDEFPSLVESSRLSPLRWLSDAAVAVVMVLLAPLLVIPLAVAFLIACIRMQHFDLRTDADRPATRCGGRSRHVPRGVGFDRFPGRPSERPGADTACPGCTYRWN